MGSKKAGKADVIEPAEQGILRKLFANIVAIKTQQAKEEDKPRMYLKVRKLLAPLKTDLAAEIIAEREK